ncbi:hypothetical protein CGJ60_23090 [Vibrio parahaemolyticus]|nr:hypothetical protein CGJ60_23090 [Vibrio parahaemolyticus]
MVEIVFSNKVKNINYVYSGNLVENAISRASTENDSEKLAKLLENRTELEAECKKLRENDTN